MADLEWVSMTREVPVAEAKAKLSELMARVAHGGERIVIARHGKAMVALVSLEDLGRIESAEEAPESDPWQRLGHYDPEMPDDETMDRMLELIYAERRRNIAEPPRLTND